MRLLATILFLFTFLPDLASAQTKYPIGIQMEVSGGQGYSAISNPDGTTAYYSTLGVEGRGHIPLLGGALPGDAWTLELIGGIRYLDLKNTAEMGNQKEVANMIGPGGGLNLRLYKLIAGAKYDFMLARHFAVGPISSELQYSMGMFNYYGGILIPLQNLAVSVTYSASKATVPKDKSGLSKDSAYSDQVYWITFIYSTGASFDNFVKLLF